MWTCTRYVGQNLDLQLSLSAHVWVLIQWCGAFTIGSMGVHCPSRRAKLCKPCVYVCVVVRYVNWICSFISVVRGSDLRAFFLCGVRCVQPNCCDMLVKSALIQDAASLLATNTLFLVSSTFMGMFLSPSCMMLDEIFIQVQDIFLHRFCTQSICSFAHNSCCILLLRLLLLLQHLLGLFAPMFAV